MQTIETITITIPVQDGYSFHELREKLSEVGKEEIAPSTLYDWIKSVCLLRSDGIYQDTYSNYDLKLLLEWLAFRSFHKRGTAARKFRKYLENQANGTV